jgi:tetratricopeptide (TPR) repeat protein
MSSPSPEPTNILDAEPSFPLDDTHWIPTSLVVPPVPVVPSKATAATESVSIEALVATDSAVTPDLEDPQDTVPEASTEPPEETVASPTPEADSIAAVAEPDTSAPVVEQAPVNAAHEPSKAVTAEAAPASTAVGVIEQGVPLSQSCLWQIMKTYFLTHGVEAWKKVPFLVTCNALIANTYAKLIHAYLLDRLPHLTADAPIYLLEWGSGTGRFAYNLIRQLIMTLNADPRFAHLTFCYVITDLCEPNVAFWQAHEKFKPLAEAGQVDFAVMNPEKPEDFTIQLRHQQITLTPERLKNPLVLIANYFFDSIPHDVFRVNGHQLEAGTLTVTGPLLGAGKLPTIDAVKTRYQYHAITSDYYTEPAFNTLLADYARTMHNASIILPIAGLQAIQRLRELTAGNMFMVSSDKGFVSPEVLLGHYEPSYAEHGSFSYSVNYNAILRYFEQAGGSVYASNALNLDLQTVACVLDDYPEPLVELNRLAPELLNGQNGINQINPLMSLAHLAQLPKEPAQQSNLLTSLLALYRFSHYEPAMLFSTAALLEHVIHTISFTQRVTLMHTLDAMWQNYYPFSAENNFPMVAGAILCKLGLHEKARKFLNYSLTVHAPEPATYYYLGACDEGVRNYTSAKAYYEKAVALDPNYAIAKDRLSSLTLTMNYRLTEEHLLPI